MRHSSRHNAPGAVHSTCGSTARSSAEFLPRAANAHHQAIRRWASDGDTAAITTYINGFTASHVRAPTPLMAAMYRANISAGAAFLALARRDTLAAVRRLIATRDTLHECWYENRVVLVQLLAATGRYREAGERLARRWPGTTQCSNGVDDVVWTMERAANTRAARDGRFRRKSACQG